MRKLVCTGVVVVASMSWLATAHAARLGFDCSPHDCGQPLSTGAGPAVSDCLFILHSAVGSSACDLCLCDVNRRDDGITATDALTCLHASVGVPDLLECPCVYVVPQQAGGTFELVVTSGSTVDAGTSGAAHGASVGSGMSLFAEIVRRCDGTGGVCHLDSDCSNGETCTPTCGVCSGEDSECDVAGPVAASRCMLALNKTCTSNADCESFEGSCEKLAAPPLPFAAQGVPTCVTSYFAEDLTGTTDLVTGAWGLSALLRTRVHLGLELSMPCPRCGAPAQTPAVGDTFACEGGPRDGSTCTVEAVSPLFGGTSNDCPPNITWNVSGPGLPIRLERLSTGAVSVDAVLPCGGLFANLHPSNGGAVCIDTLAPCSTNADCLRCTDAPTTACTSNADCANGGHCAAAPEQPVACGLYCHCGFCDGNPDAPCFNDSQCDAGQTCAQGSSQAQQAIPNDCADLVCGRGRAEHCCQAGDAGCVTPTPLAGTCADQPYRNCEGDTDCTSAGATGPCTLSARACFENRIARSGAPSPLGSYCIDDPIVDTCATNVDCTVGACVSESAKPTMAALLCVPRTASNAVSASFGFTGPAALHLEAAVLSYRCGDGFRNGLEECDDANTTNGDGCNELCQSE